jgi:small subunit ribosomal protein S4
LARYRKSVCKLCRNEGLKLFLKGSRCDTPKCAIEKKPYPSGQHGQTRKKLSEYAIQLREKQKVRRTYGLLEGQFSKYYQKAVRLPGVTGTVMFQLMESRLDNVVYRSGLVPSRAQARQLIRHGHFSVNGRKVDIPSYLTKVGDVITPKNEPSSKLIKSLTEGGSIPPTPSWLEVDRDNVAIRTLSKVEREHIDANIKEALIVEYYSR